MRTMLANPAPARYTRAAQSTRTGGRDLVAADADVLVPDAGVEAGGDEHQLRVELARDGHHNVLERGQVLRVAVRRRWPRVKLRLALGGGDVHVPPDHAMLTL